MAQGNVISAPRRHPLRPFLFPCSISSLLMTVSSVVEWRIRHTMKRDASTRTELDARRSALMAAAQTGDRVRACDVRRRDGDVASHERDTRHVARGLGSIATTVSAAFAAFELSLPDRSRAWALLPLPAAALWVGASGLGCMRAYMLPGTHFAAIGETRDCLLFIIALSVPLSAALIVMLRRAYSLAPPLTAAMVGLASAAAAATLLNFFHPFDATAADLGVHVVAVAIVVAAAQRCRGQRTYRPVQLGGGVEPFGGSQPLGALP